MGTYGVAQLASSFRTVRTNTIQIVEDIPESKYDFVPAPGTQSVAALLKHIAFAPMLHEDMHRDKRLTTTGPTGENEQTRLASLLGPEEHEMHHRGQLMLIERILGIVPHLTRQRQERALQHAWSAT
jgi:uncharacterized damage-inducible protein DinB